MITQQYLQEHFDYNKNTGIFIRKKSTGSTAKVGVPLLGNKGNGYIFFCVQSKLQLAHRMAWLYCYGTIPDKNIDHVNGVKHDNRICNLRLANQSQNTANSKISKANTSGFKGVTWRKDTKKWQAAIMVNYKRISFGSFFDKKDAKEAYDKASVHYFGAFANS